MRTVSSMRPSMDSTSCILVEDAKAEAQDEEPRDVTSSQAPTEESLPTSTAVHSSHLSLSSKLSPGSNTDQQQQQQQQQQWPAVVEVREYGVPHASTIPPFQFWNSEFRNKEPAFIRLNFTLPWGANFAVYGRRNVAPSVTQYDFVEFIKGGRVDHRLKRSVDGGLLMVGPFDPTRRGEDMIQFQSPAAVSFTTSTTQKWRDHRGDVLHVIPPPLFIVNHNHLEKSPGSSEDVSEGLGVSTTEKVSSWLSGGTKSKRLKSRNSTRHRKTPGLPAAPTYQEVSRRKRVVVGHKVSRRSSGIGISGSLVMMVNVTLLQYLDTGRWFLSVYNDDLRPQEVTLVVAEAEGVSTACPNDCGGHGSCYLGKCDCIDGYEGVDCSKTGQCSNPNLPVIPDETDALIHSGQMMYFTRELVVLCAGVCPVLCSNHGKYGGGMCHCEEGWKGPECDIPEHDCQVPDCSGHGQCLGGVCICRPGWKGTFCNQVDCVDPLCSSHGSCVGGKCYCKAGWQGVNCSIVDQQVYQCLPGCSEHGSYDLEMGACICENYWSGTDCSQAWTVALMVVVTKASVSVTLDGLVTAVTCCLVTRDAPSTANARTGPVSALRDGTGGIVPYVWPVPYLEYLRSGSIPPTSDLDRHGQSQLWPDLGFSDMEYSFGFDQLFAKSFGSSCPYKARSGEIKLDLGQLKSDLNISVANLASCPSSTSCNCHVCRQNLCAATRADMLEQSRNRTVVNSAGCRSACNHHGTCTLEDSEYHCVCSDGWAGLDCSIRLELECDDDIDNDEGKAAHCILEMSRIIWLQMMRDPLASQWCTMSQTPDLINGMTDCSDSECCNHHSCTEHIMCHASNDPVEVLLRKQPPSVTASFYQRVKFLIEENSVQSYAHMDEYSESFFAYVVFFSLLPPIVVSSGTRLRRGFYEVTNSPWLVRLWVSSGDVVSVSLSHSLSVKPSLSPPLLYTSGLCVCSRVSVMRGQVVTPQGLGIVGIRVSVDRDSRFGFTLTRAGGWEFCFGGFDSWHISVVSQLSDFHLQRPSIFLWKTYPTTKVLDSDPEDSLHPLRPTLYSPYRFDVLVNGGGAVTLQFQRNPFLPLTRTVFVPWNQIVVLPPIAMQLSDESDLYREHGSSAPGLPNNLPGRATPLFGGTQRAPCLDHDHELLRPVIMSTWMPEKVGAMPGRCLVLAETQILQESIQIPGSSLHLMYQSSQAPGYLSTVLMRLTHSTVPTTLTHVHVRVEIEGSVHTRAYEADPHLTHTFAWNKRNVYKQKVYGVAQAKISVGYQYSSCPSILWETQTAVLQGFDVDISDVGGWSLDIHHHYNFHEGVLQNGEGINLLFKHCHEFFRRKKAPPSTSSTAMFNDIVTGILQKEEGNTLLFKNCLEFSRRKKATPSTSSTAMFNNMVTGILQKEEGTTLHFKHCHEFSRRKKATTSTSSTAMFNDIVTGILQKEEGNTLHFKHCHEFSRRVMAPPSTSSTAMFNDNVTGTIQKEESNSLHFKHCHEFSRRMMAPPSTSSTAMCNDSVTGILQKGDGTTFHLKHCHRRDEALGSALDCSSQDIVIVLMCCEVDVPGLVDEIGRKKATTSTSSTAMFNDIVTGILQKGDGTTLHFKQYPRTVKVVMGTGLQRPLMCSDCNGSAKDSRLLTPVALTSGPDGSLYVGDFNLVRRITPEGNVYTVLQLSTTQVSYQYYLSVSPADGHLYISNSEKHQILRALSVEPVEEPAINYEPVVGSGERCIPGDETHCGDEGPARDAKLAHPKGLAIAADKTMYIADGTNIRAVDPQGVIHTLVGHHGHHNHWTPVPCHGAIPAQQAQLQWPTGLSLSPLDGSLHFIDDRLVLKLTDDLKVKVVAGTPLHCHASTVEHHQGTKTDTTTGVETAETQIQGVPESEEGSKATSTVLGSVLALAFSPTGDLFIAESDSRKVNAIRVVDSAGRISDFAGKQQEKLNRMQSCDCNSNSSLSTTPGGATLCPCGGLLPDDTAPDHNSKETMLSSTAQFTSISALTVSPDGVLNVADQGSLHILALEHYLPTHDENGEFRIPYPPTREVYVFNRYGQHIATKDLTSGKTRYSFLYSKNTSFGKLSTVTDSSGNKILFLRDYSNVVSTIENTQDHKSDLKISGVGFLVKFTEKGKMEIELDYDSSTGLLTSRSDSHGGGGSTPKSDGSTMFCRMQGGETFMYHYGDHGRLIDVVLPTGETMNLASHLTPDDGLAIQVSAGVQSSLADMDQQLQHLVLLKMEGQGAKKLVARDGPLAAATEAASFLNGSFSVRSSWGGQLTCAAMARHPLLELSLPVEAEMLTMWSQQVLTLGDSLVNTMQWTYSLVGDVRTTQQTLHKELWVNQSRVLGIEFDQANGHETFYDRDRQALFIVSFDPAGLPQSWAPAGGGLPVNITYDRFNRVDGWKWGVQSEKYSYESHGLLSEISSPQDGTTKYTYNDLNILSHISLPSQRTFSLKYDEDGGLRHVTLPGGTHHSFSCQPSLGFLRVTYTPPGSVRAYIQHYSHSGALLQTVFPGDGARVLYRYHPSGQLAEVLHGDGRSQLNYSPVTSFPSEVLHSERDFEYRWDYQFQAGLLTEERLDFGAKTGLSNAKFTYEYDTNFRLTGVQGRIGGQNLPEHSLGYNPRTGAPEQLGQFKVSRTKSNETSVYDGTAIFSRINNPHFQDVQVAVTIHRMEVFRMEFTHDSRSQTRTYTRNVGVNTYTNVKNYTWDSDGQLSGVEAQEPWGFRYDDNGNMLSLTYRGNTIPMEYNVMDRIVKFGEGLYRYDNRGLVVQNAREERFHYNAKGLLVRATKRGRFDVRYYYDHLDRLATRKDNYGNVTQFFYTNHQRPNEVSQIYSPRDGKLMSLVYDDRGHLIFAQVYRHKYYVATDQCGTPIMVFNQYGEGIREIMRSPYGHIVYDSNPYLYLPVDFCGGLLDKVTSLVHMPNGKVYDPLIGQWMSPMWEGVLDRVANPTHLHLYRFNGNDPINVRRNPQHLTDHQSWLTLLGYDLRSLAPQLYPSLLPGGGLPPSMVLLGAQPPLTPHVMTALSSVQLRPAGSGPAPFTVASGFLAQLTQRRLGDASTLSSPPRSAVKRDTWPPEDFPATNPASVFPLRRLGSACDPPFGRGILVSRTTEGKAIINSVPTANAIYRDVFTSVFNQSYLLPFTFFHNMQQDVFYFVKEDPWRAADDRGQLKRLGGQVNTTFHEKEAGSQEAAVAVAGGGKVADLKIHGISAVVNLRYGTTPDKEKQRLLHHAKVFAVRKAWHREKEALRNGFAGSVDWSATEMDEILKVGYAASYDGEYVHDVQRYPELAEDPFNVRFMKKTASTTSEAVKRRRKKRSMFQEEGESIQGKMSLSSMFRDLSFPSPGSLKEMLLSSDEIKSCSNSKHWWLPWTHHRPAC
uniref:Tenascin-like protein n=2 Tax=Timema TaxID=61471 RepID=A0A7R9ARP9_TIMSH|nr:unnamed protein product [Timema shepardi]